MTAQSAARVAYAAPPRQVRPTASSVREQLDATTKAVDAAEHAHLRDALESVQWERRGLLQRLVRHPRP